MVPQGPERGGHEEGHQDRQDGRRQVPASGAAQERDRGRDARCSHHRRRRCRHDLGARARGPGLSRPYHREGPRARRTGKEPLPEPRRFRCPAVPCREDRRSKGPSQDHRAHRRRGEEDRRVRGQFRDDPHRREHDQARRDHDCDRRRGIPADGVPCRHKRKRYHPARSGKEALRREARPEVRRALRHDPVRGLARRARPVLLARLLPGRDQERHRHQGEESRGGGGDHLPRHPDLRPARGLLQAGARSGRALRAVRCRPQAGGRADGRQGPGQGLGLHAEPGDSSSMRTGSCFPSVSGPIRRPTQSAPCTR